MIAAFDSGRVTSDARALLLGATDKAIGLIERFAGCFADGRLAKDVEHRVATLVGQRVFGIALGYEDLIDHDRLRTIRCWRRSPASLPPVAPAARYSPARAS